MGAGDPERDDEDLERSFIRFVLRMRRKLCVISLAEGSRLRLGSCCCGAGGGGGRLGGGGGGRPAMVEEQRETDYWWCTVVYVLLLYLVPWAADDRVAVGFGLNPHGFADESRYRRAPANVARRRVVRERWRW